ncbi:hypothetical protein J8L98_02145 [Pseudoalteromonas sp. MMG013]|uniref:hypothetical protein n=1 Tax=unclassified Pseudoalteromonas TaxID=194690 RepID=UPI001B37E37C|nr:MULTISPECIES: hypothetical protein [unclassified Pseudoalteromonas]MBQ4852963.1 hypothetical protein [Pseudoalteromonas sp. MMG012]MBQ4860493.1 hypothetical protein [Pseudoalteromonas sp. MMG013]
MFSALYFALLLVLIGALLHSAFRLRGGPKDYALADAFEAEGLGAKAYMLLRKRNRIDDINDQFLKYIALVDWKKEAEEFNALCESSLQGSSANLIKLPLDDN